MNFTRFFIPHPHPQLFCSGQKAVISPSLPVSQSIRKLEESTGSVLFVRGPRSVKLTAAGEMLYSHVDQAYSLFRAAEGKNAGNCSPSALARSK